MSKKLRRVEHIMKKVKERTVRCDECGFGYVFPIDNRIHAKYHYRYLDATYKFGQLLLYHEREELKQKSWTIFFDECSSDAERIVAVEQIFQSHFSRSVESNNWDLEHPPFKTYCLMLLDQKHWQDIVTSWPGLQEALVKKNSTIMNCSSKRAIYGSIPNGKTVWRKPFTLRSKSRRSFA